MQGPSQPPVLGSVSVRSGQGDAWLPLRSLWSQQRLSPPFSPTYRCWLTRDPGGSCCSFAAAGNYGLVSFCGATVALMMGRTGQG